MSQADEFRAYAKERLEFARTAASTEQRQSFLDVAATWSRAAAKLDGGAAVPDRTISPASAPGVALRSYGLDDVINFFCRSRIVR